MVLDWMIIAVSPLVTDRLSVVMVRVTLHEVSPNAIAMAVAMDTARYLIAFLSRSFCISVNCFIGFFGWWLNILRVSVQIRARPWLVLYPAERHLSAGMV